MQQIKYVLIIECFSIANFNLFSHILILRPILRIVVLYL